MHARRETPVCRERKSSYMLEILSLMEKDETKEEEELSVRKSVYG
jgi:hypothetical protein